MKTQVQLGEFLVEIPVRDLTWEQLVTYMLATRKPGRCRRQYELTYGFWAD